MQIVTLTNLALCASLGSAQWQDNGLSCKAVAGSGATDGWCNANCNYNPPNCPSNMCQCSSPSPSPPAPVPTPSPPPSPPSPLPSEIIGYYSWNWGSGSTGPAGANAGCAFTGLIDVKNAISQYTANASWCCPALKGTKYLTLGGGNSAGAFTASALQGIIDNAALIKPAGYGAVMYDVEEVSGSSSTMIPLFQKSFAALKKEGLIVAVTTSHSAPYQCDAPADAVAFVKAWAADSNVDILSPQLYSSGRESAPEFAETNSCKDAGCTWDLYKGSKAILAPSIVETSHYAAVQKYFSSTLGMTVGGYFQWAQQKGFDKILV